MNLGADVAAALPFLRAQAQTRFTETFEFFNETDPAPFESVPGREVVASGVPGRVKFPGNQGRVVDAAGQGVAVERVEVHVKVGDPLVPGEALEPPVLPGTDSVPATPGLLVEVLSSSVDEALVGRIFRVADDPVMGQVTSWRIPVEDYGRRADG